jgi:CHAD domain-containing protein
VAKALPVPDVAADTPIGPFAARVIETRAGEVAALAAKRTNGNPRGVHDRRVAIRRLRTALEVFAPELPKRSRGVRKELKGAFSELGPRRDADVALELVRSFEPSLVQGDMPGWRFVVAALEAERAAAPAALDRERVLRAGDEATALAAKAASRNGTVAEDALRQLIAPRLAAVQRDLGALDHPESAKALHELRIDAKRLRYFLEAAEPALGARTARGAAAARDLQSLLGDIHDCDVLLPWLREQRRTLRQEDVAAAREGRRPPNAARYRGLQSVDTLVRARRATLADKATARHAEIAEALDRAGTELAES